MRSPHIMSGGDEKGLLRRDAAYAFISLSTGTA
jgi:hypothetical protein